MLLSWCCQVRKLLCCSAPVPIKLDASENDPELPAKQQALLMAAASRTMALPVGRGALTLGTLKTLPGETLEVPMLCLSGLVSETPRVVVNLDLSHAQPPSSKAWWVTRVLCILRSSDCKLLLLLADWREVCRLHQTKLYYTST